MSKAIVFLATIPPFKSSLTLGGETPCVKFEAPASEMANFVGLAALQGVVLRVTVEVHDDERESARKSTKIHI